MQKNISRVLVLSSDPSRRAAALQTFSRAGVEIIFAINGREARREIVRASTAAEPPGLIILHLEYYGEEFPLDLFHEIRKKPAMQEIPILILVESRLEQVMVQNLALRRSFCGLAPLNYGTLVFALPSLEIDLKDSLLYLKRPAAEDIEDRRRNFASVENQRA